MCHERRIAQGIAQASNSMPAQPSPSAVRGGTLVVAGGEKVVLGASNDLINASGIWKIIVSQREPSPLSIVFSRAGGKIVCRSSVQTLRLMLSLAI